MGPDATQRLRASRWLIAVGTVLLLAGASQAAEQKFAVYCVRFSPDGKQLVSGGATRPVQVWDLEKGTEIASFKHDGWMQTVDFSPDGKYVLSGVRGLTMRVWDIAEKKMHRQFNHGGWVTCGLFLPKGNLVLSIGGDDQKKGKAGLRFWDLETGREKQAFTPSKNAELAGRLGWASLSADGKLLAVLGDNAVVLWDVDKSEPIRTLTGMNGLGWKMALSPDGKRCVAGSMEKNFCVWDATNGKLLRTISRPSGVRAVAFSPDGKVFADGGLNGQVSLWDARTLVKVRDIPAHKYICESIAFSPNGLLLATGSFDNTIKVFNARTGQLLRSLDGQTRRSLPPLPTGPAIKPPPTSQPDEASAD